MCPLSTLRTGSDFQDVHRSLGKSSAAGKGPSPASHTLAWQTNTGSFVIQLSLQISALVAAISARQQQLWGCRRQRRAAVPLAGGVRQSLPRQRPRSPCLSPFMPPSISFTAALCSLPQPCICLLCVPDPALLFLLLLSPQALSGWGWWLCYGAVSGCFHEATQGKDIPSPPTVW